LDKVYFTEGVKLKDLAWLGHSQVSRRRTFDQYSSGEWLYLPSYAVFNAAVYYQVDKFRVAVNLNNITNETYL
jgi:iron complex outermembrane recepter protein